MINVLKKIRGGFFTALLGGLIWLVLQNLLITIIYTVLGGSIIFSVITLIDKLTVNYTVPGRRCPACLDKGETVWVIPGKCCPQCGTPVNRVIAIITIITLLLLSLVIMGDIFLLFLNFSIPFPAQYIYSGPSIYF